MPSIVIAPESGVIKVAARLAIVVLPDPELPTNAVTDPEGASKLISFTTSFPSSYEKETWSNLMSPFKTGN